MEKTDGVEWRDKRDVVRVVLIWILRSKIQIGLVEEVIKWCNV